jgi:hypothetical protein
MADVADTVTLLVPRDHSFLPLLHMVLGGIGLRHDLSFDALDDLQLAVDNILAEDESTEPELTMEVTLGGPLLHIRLSSLSGADLEYMLKEGAVPAPLTTLTAMPEPAARADRRQVLFPD